MDTETQLIIQTTPLAPGRYDDSLAISGQVADQAAQGNTFAEAAKTWRPNTRRRYLYDLDLFSAYLASAGIKRLPEGLYSDAEAWRGMSFGHAKAFKVWLEKGSYAVGTMRGCLSTLHVFCTLAGPPPAGAGVIDETTLAAILSVSGAAGKTARNLDEDRQAQGLRTRRGDKKTTPTWVDREQALTLKEATTNTRRSRPRQHDSVLEARDALMMGLLIEHALRCSEVAALTIDAINLQAGTIRIERLKTSGQDTQTMHAHTAAAARAYLGQIERRKGPLFVGYGGQPLSTRAINQRVRVIGETLGIDRLSPHDLRHYWTYDALENQTPLNVVQQDGGWATPAMPLHYAKRVGVVGGKAIISERKEAQGE